MLNKQYMDDLAKKLATIGKAINIIKGNMATKNDLKNLEVKLLEKIEDSQMEIIAVVDEHKEDKENVKVLGKRVERLEDNAGLPPYSGQ